MADDKSQKGDATTGKSTLINVDFAKSNEQYIKDAEKYYIVPKLVREVFPDLIKLIFETESMDEEEREYWLQILPIMTEDQIKKFREILVNEKVQLEKLDKEYDNEMSQLEKKHTVAINDEEVKEKREALRAREATAEEKEAKAEEDLLKELDNL